MQIVSAFFLIRPFHKLRSRSQGGESMCCFQSAGNTGHMAREIDEGKKPKLVLYKTLLPSVLL
jgi:hypothetical protein